MMGDEYQHVPVLVKEVVQGLNIQPGGTYVDCTFGRGGHSRAILGNLNENGKLYVFDRDPQAIEVASRLSGADPRVVVFHSRFSELSRILEMQGVHGRVNGILFDLGVSSPQIDDPDRGFSFSYPGKLDMRMDPSSGVSAMDWVNQSRESDIAYVLKVYGEEKFSKRIARNIVKSRQEHPITTTTQLTEIIADSIIYPEKNKHPATRTFQAIRIFLNDELNEIQAGLLNAYEVLADKGRLAVVSFHSLEDRIVKRFIRKFAKNDPYPDELPVTADKIKPGLKIIGRLITPSENELSANVRARSARLRIAEKQST